MSVFSKYDTHTMRNRTGQYRRARRRRFRAQNAGMFSHLGMPPAPRSLTSKRVKLGKRDRAAQREAMLTSTLDYVKASIPPSQKHVPLTQAMHKGVYGKRMRGL